MHILYSLRIALAFKDILRRYSVTRYDLEVLSIIYLSVCPLSYKAIFGRVKSGLSVGAYNTLIRRLTNNGYITRHPLHKYVQYHITQDGIRLLHDVNMALEQAVRAMLFPDKP